MPWSDQLSTLNASVFPELGEPCGWSPGSGVDPVWVIIREPEIELGFGRSSTTTQQRILEVQRCEVAAPSEGDQVAMVEGPRRFTITAEPTLSDDGSVWTCEARELP